MNDTLGDYHPVGYSPLKLADKKPAESLNIINDRKSLNHNDNKKDDDRNDVYIGKNGDDENDNNEDTNTGDNNDDNKRLDHDYKDTDDKLDDNDFNNSDNKDERSHLRFKNFNQENSEKFKKWENTGNYDIRYIFLYIFIFLYV
jgi:hypothetical protein